MWPRALIANLSALLRTALEIVVPLVFLGLLCLPRYLIADTQFPGRYFAPTNITSLAWSSVRHFNQSRVRLPGPRLPS